MKNSIEFSEFLKLLTSSVSERNIFNKLLSLILKNIKTKSDLVLHKKAEEQDLKTFCNLCLKQSLFISIINHQVLDTCLLLTDDRNINIECTLKSLKIIL